MTLCPPHGRLSSPAFPATAIGDKSGIRLLANTIAHQWWGSEVSPRTLNDAWIENGMCRYGELMFLEDQNGPSALRAALTDVAASALAYDTIPLSSAGRLGPFTPEFQSMTFDKGAMIFHMLRWEVGDKMLPNIFKGVLSQYTDKPIRAEDFYKVAEEVSQQQLTPFFSQWVDGTGAPKFTDKYSVYRLGNNKGFRTIGEIDQDLDLFSMPVDLRIETDGKTVNEKSKLSASTRHSWSTPSAARAASARTGAPCWPPHLGFHLAQDDVLLAVEEEAEPADVGAVGLAVDPQVARGGALIDRVQQAGPEPPPAGVVLLDVERAGAELEDPLQDLDRPAQALGPGERAVELDAAVERLAGEVHPGKVLAGGDLEVGERLVVLEVLVVLGLDVLDQPRLQQQGIDLAVGGQEVDVGHLADPVADPAVLARPSCGSTTPARLRRFLALPT